MVFFSYLRSIYCIYSRTYSNRLICEYIRYTLTYNRNYLGSFLVNILFFHWLKHLPHPNKKNKKSSSIWHSVRYLLRGNFKPALLLDEQKQQQVWSLNEALRNALFVRQATLLKTSKGGDAKELFTLFSIIEKQIADLNTVSNQSVNICCQDFNTLSVSAIWSWWFYYWL